MIIILLIPKEAKSAMKWTAAIVTLLQVVLAVLIYINFNQSLGGINTKEGTPAGESAGCGPPSPPRGRGQRFLIVYFKM